MELVVLEISFICLAIISLLITYLTLGFVNFLAMFFGMIIGVTTSAIFICIWRWFFVMFKGFVERIKNMMVKQKACHNRGKQIFTDIDVIDEEEGLNDRKEKEEEQLKCRKKERADDCQKRVEEPKQKEKNNVTFELDIPKSKIKDRTKDRQQEKKKEKEKLMNNQVSQKNFNQLCNKLNRLY
jgi:ABC-type siderophore export system fused ATPase/permease subunit